MNEQSICPKCGAEMIPQPLTDAAGSPVRFGGSGAGSGALSSLVCPGCGYAELHADPDVSVRSAPAEGPTATGDDPLAWTTADKAAFSAHAAAEARQQRFAALRNMSASSTEPRPLGPLALVAVAVTAGLAAAGVTLLYLMSGPIMELGGMVASGGPYEIAHPAPDWAPLVTMGFVLGLFAFFANLFVAANYGRPNLILPFWAAIFGSQGWNFLYYGWIDPPGGEKVITWIVLGVMFWLMAAPAVVLMLVPATWRGFSGAFGIATLTGVVAGVVVAMQLFATVAA